RQVSERLVPRRQGSSLPAGPRGNQWSLDASPNWGTKAISLSAKQIHKLSLRFFPKRQVAGLLLGGVRRTKSLRRDLPGTRRQVAGLPRRRVLPALAARRKGVVVPLARQ